ncbi:MAG: acyl--CoA ligase [Deltaproteobacteria bacterium]|nr:acyl--CoA ligase [Candidatus Anaeroferrophillacea bacterium]
MKNIPSAVLIWYLRRFKGLRTPAAVVRWACRRWRDRVFLVPAGGGEAVTFGELARRADRLAGFFARRGMQPGEVVMFAARNCPDGYVVRAACHLSGMVFFAFEPGLPPAAVRHLAAVSGARLFIFRGADLHPEVDPAAIFSGPGAAEGVGSPVGAVAAGESAAPAGCVPPATPVSRSAAVIDIDISRWRGILAGIGCGDEPERFAVKHLAVERTAAEAGDEEKAPVATLNTSSGTTSPLPKIIRLTNASWIESLYLILAGSVIGRRDQAVFLSTLPLATAGSTTFLPTLLGGIRVVLFPGPFDPAALAAAIRAHGVNRLYLTPSWLIELLGWCRRHGETLPGVEQIITGTERLPRRWFREAVAFFGPRVFMGYGMVEMLPPIAMLRPEHYRAAIASGTGTAAGGCGRAAGEIPGPDGGVDTNDGRLSSCGPVVPGVAVRIVDRDGTSVPAGTTGRIEISSPARSAGYLWPAEENELRFHDGWFRTDDYGRLDDVGFLYIFGRDTEVIAGNDGFTGRFALELEDVVYELPFVERCCAFRAAGELHLAVVPGDDAGWPPHAGGAPLPAEIRRRIVDWCEPRLPGELVPVHIDVRSSLPVTNLGKLGRRLLAAAVEDCRPPAGG